MSGQATVQTQITTKPTITLVASGLLQRQCACGQHTSAGGECEECKQKREGTLQRAAINRSPVREVPPIVHEVLHSPGQPLDAATRAFMEPRFGHDFSRVPTHSIAPSSVPARLAIGAPHDSFEQEAEAMARRVMSRSSVPSSMRRDFSGVRIHTDARAGESARAVNALAYTVGQNIVFGAGQYAPSAPAGRRLLAHELTHVIQQGNIGDLRALENAALQRSAVPGMEPAPTSERSEGGPIEGGQVIPASSPTASRIPSPEICPPPEGMQCSPAMDSPGAVTNAFIFPVNSATLNSRQIAEIDAAAASWRAAGGAVTVRVDGYASAEGECGYNWNLSCRRAQTVATELESPRDGSPGVPSGSVEVIAHGESAEAGRALAPNRRATISIPTAPPTPTPPNPPACTFPVRLGGARGCGSGTDFTHFDFPSISAASTAKLTAWALGHTPPRPVRSLVTDTECELEMDGVLVSLAGGAGHDAFSHFRAGTGSTVTHGPTSTLGAMALVSGSFRATVARVKADIEAQLAAQASSGALDPCRLSVTPPATHFAFSDGAALKAVIGGTQGEQLFATSFSGSAPMRSYSIALRFLICDDFGVDESDLYAPGLFPFWVLQHERSASLYAPFINELDLSVTISGTF